MNTGFNRRQFLAATGATAAVGATTNLTLALEPWLPARGAELFKISLAQWSLHRALKGGELDNLDFAKVAKEEFGIEGVEYVNQFFKDKADDERYHNEQKRVCEGEGVRSELIMCDGGRRALQPAETRAHDLTLPRRRLAAG